MELGENRSGQFNFSEKAQRALSELEGLLEGQTGHIN